jgi:hypothetical protein
LRAGTMKKTDYTAIIESMDEDEAIDYVLARIKETIEDTLRTRMRVDRALKEIDSGQH